MKTLELNAYGVSEMNHQEMMNENGGWINALWFLAGLLVAEALDLNANGALLRVKMRLVMGVPISNLSVVVHP
jgi:hypothetical protein